MILNQDFILWMKLLICIVLPIGLTWTTEIVGSEELFPRIDAAGFSYLFPIMLFNVAFTLVSGDTSLFPTFFAFQEQLFRPTSYSLVIGNLESGTISPLGNLINRSAEITPDSVLLLLKLPSSVSLEFGLQISVMLLGTMFLSCLPLRGKTFFLWTVSLSMLFTCYYKSKISKCTYYVFKHTPRCTVW